MEIRVNEHGPGSLATKVFFSDEKGFEVASVIVMGKTDAVLIDAQWTLSNAHRVVAEILETGKNLTTVYVTHAHPDHYFGLGPIAEAFPGPGSSPCPRSPAPSTASFSARSSTGRRRSARPTCREKR